VAIGGQIARERNRYKETIMVGWLLMLTHHDERLLHRLVASRRSLVERLRCEITHRGDAGVVVGPVLLLLLEVVPGASRAGWIAAFALVLSHLGVQFLKRKVTRPLPRLPVGIRSLVEAPDRFSFPSGHAAASLSVGLSLAVLMPPWPAAAVVALSILVGVSRCYLGVHYPTDVLAGWILAGLAFLAAKPVLLRLGVLPFGTLP
jgi:undecaprenyl-diphosphatase